MLRRLWAASARRAPRAMASVRRGCAALGAPPSRAGPIRPSRSRAVQLSRAISSARLNELLPLLMRHSDELDIRHVSNLWNKLGRRLNALHERDGPRAPARWCSEWRDEITELLGQSLYRLSPERLGDACGGREIATIAHGVAKCRIKYQHTWQLWEALAEAARARAHTFSTKDHSITLWAFATSVRRESPRDLFQRAAAAELRSPGGLRACDPRQLGTMVWAYATAGVRHDRLFDVVASAASRPDARELIDPPAVANLACAYAKLDKPAGGLYAELAEAAAPMLGEFSPQELSNTLWAYAKSSARADELFAGAARAALPKIREFNTQNLANTAWAYATIGGVHGPGACAARDELFDALGDAAASRLGEATQQELANLVWAFAVTDTRHDRLTSAASAAIAAVATPTPPVAAVPPPAAHMPTPTPTPTPHPAAMSDANAHLPLAPRAPPHAAEPQRQPGSAPAQLVAEATARQLHQWQLWVALEWKSKELLLPLAERRRLMDIFVDDDRYGAHAAAHDTASARAAAVTIHAATLPANRLMYRQVEGDSRAAR